MRDNEFDTAEMLKRLQRQVSRLRGGSSEDSVTIFQKVSDTTQTSDTVDWGDWSVAFDGLNSGDYIEVPDSSSLDITGDITIASTWKIPSTLDVDSNNNYRNVIGKPDHTGAYGIIFEDSGAVDWSVVKGGSRENIRGGTIPMNGTVFTVVVTHDTSTGESVIYIDGDVAHSGTVATGSIDTTTSPFYISTPDGSHQALGTVDRVYVDARKWSATEAAMYHSGAVVDDAARRLEFSLSAGSGTTASDTSGNTNDGTFNGSPEWVAPLGWERNLGFIWSVSKWSQQSW